MIFTERRQFSPNERLRFCVRWRFEIQMFNKPQKMIRNTNVDDMHSAANDAKPLLPAGVRVLVACEESQATTIELRKLGFNAWSCDLQDCSGGHPEWHIKDDVLNVLDEGWDMMIAHPTCTYLTNSGVCWIYNKDGSRNEERWQNLKEGAEFFKALLNAPATWS